MRDELESGRPSSIGGPMEEALEKPAAQPGAHLTSEHARQVLIERPGRAPALTTIRRRLRRLRDEPGRHPAFPSDRLPEGVETLPGREQEPPPPAAAADSLGRAIAATEAILATAGLALEPDDKAGLVLALHRKLYEEGDEASAGDSGFAPTRDRGVV